MTRPIVALIALLVLALDAYLVHALFLDFPVVWIDEAYFASPAIDLIEHGRMSTSVLAGILPGMEAHTYWMPPAYFLTVAAVFRVFGIGILQLRILSVVLAVVSMLLAYRIARTIGFDRWLALAPVALMGLDVLFLRGARIGRMEMLTIALMLLSLWAVLRATSAVRIAPGWLVLSALAATAATLAHPFGAFVFPGVTATLLATQRGRSLRWLALVAALAVLLMIPWLLYILQDWSAFQAQQAAQFARKASRHHGGLSNLIENVLYQYNRNPYAEAALWGLGLVGLLQASLQNRRLIGLLVTHVCIAVLIFWSQEMWYVAYLTPFTALGLSWLAFGPSGQPLKPLARQALIVTSLVGLVLIASKQSITPMLEASVLWLLGFAGLLLAAGERRVFFAAVAAQVVLVGLIFAGFDFLFPIGLMPLTVLGLWWLARRVQQLGWQVAALRMSLGVILALIVLPLLASLGPLHAYNEGPKQELAEYNAFADELSRQLPQGARVQLCAIPEPFFGLRTRTDLTIRVCPPSGIAGMSADATSSPVWKDAEYVVIRSVPVMSPNAELTQWVQKHGVHVGDAFPARTKDPAEIYRVTVPSGADTAGQ